MKIKRVHKIRYRWTIQLVLGTSAYEIVWDLKRISNFWGQFYQVWSVQSGEISKICLNLIFVKIVFCLNPLKRWSLEIQFSTFENFHQINPPFLYSTRIPGRWTVSPSKDPGSRTTDAFYPGRKFSHVPWNHVNILNRFRINKVTIWPLLAWPQYQIHFNWSIKLLARC